MRGTGGKGIQFMQQVAENGEGRDWIQKQQEQRSCLWHAGKEGHFCILTVSLFKILNVYEYRDVCGHCPLQKKKKAEIFPLLEPKNEEV